MNIPKKHMEILDIIVKISMDNASRVFSETIKMDASIEHVCTRQVDINEIIEEMSNDLREMAGVTLGLTGVYLGKSLFTIPLDGALILQDIYLGLPPGSTRKFDKSTESVVQEIGNILANSIGNLLTSDLGPTLLLIPLHVTFGFAGSIFGSFVLEEALEHDKLLLIETRFKLSNTEVDCSFFLIPDIITLNEPARKLENFAMQN